MIVTTHTTAALGHRALHVAAANSGHVVLVATLNLDRDMGWPHPNFAEAVDSPVGRLSPQRRADLTIMNCEANPSAHCARRHRRESAGRYGELVWGGASRKVDGQRSPLQSRRAHRRELVLSAGNACTRHVRRLQRRSYHHRSRSSQAPGQAGSCDRPQCCRVSPIGWTRTRTRRGHDRQGVSPSVLDPPTMVAG